jgi:aminoacrylate hydrolase
VPGLGLAASAWGPVVELLEPSHCVLVTEPRGSGTSDAPAGPYTAELVAADLLCTLDAAGCDSVHLVGLSMGGMIAQDFAVRHPDRLESLVLLSTFAAPDAWFTRLFTFRRELIRSVGIREHYRLYVMFIFSPFAFRRIPETIARVDATVQANPPDEQAYLAQIDYCLAHDRTSALAELRVPTLVIVGSQDILTPPPLGRELAAAIPNARFHEVEGASHGLWLEYPGELVRLCDDFFRASSRGVDAGRPPAGSTGTAGG